jgi:cysteinyl-tRNA synthetase
MNDDLNTSIALSVMFELVRLAQKLFDDSRTTLATFNLVEVLFDRLGGDCLGIVRQNYPLVGGADDKKIDMLVNILIEQRNEARQNKDFDEADKIRNKLEEIGILLEDKADQTTWRAK